jgi:crossover junction endodeoxyribonuclease RuvC
VIFIGIDPGLTGAIASIDRAGVCAVQDMPTVQLPGDGLVRRRIDGLALARLLRQMVPAGNECLVMVEDVQAIGGSAVQTMGSMMRSVGVIECAVEILRMPMQRANPRRWKRVFGLKADKGESLEVARRLFPAAAGQIARKKDHNRAEALLLAMYAKGVAA